MRMRYVLALDQGTTSSRAILFDEQGRPVSVAQREFRQIFPQPGWVEHDPKEIFQTQREVAREAVRKAGVPLKDLMAVGITNQRETTIVWDRQSGEPIHNAIVWQDRRTAPQCAELKAARRREPGARAHRPGDRSVFQRHQDRVAARQRSRRAGARRARRARLRHGGHLAHLAPHRQPHPRHRRLERLAHAALQHPHERLGCRAAARVRRAARDPSRRASLGARLRHAARRHPRRAASSSAASPATSRRRCSARPATAPAWRRTPTAPAASCCCTPATRWCSPRTA